MQPWETKTVEPGNIFVEGHTPAAFQSRVQTKTGYFPMPAFSPPVFRGRKAGQPGLEGAGVCSSHLVLSWILGHAAEHTCVTAQTQPKLIRCSKPPTACATVKPVRTKALERNSWGHQLCSPTSFHGRTSYKNKGQIYAFFFTAYFYNPPFS